jgi:hypothetical protein
MGWIALLVGLGCRGPADASDASDVTVPDDTDATELHAQVGCPEAAGDEGIAIWLRLPGQSRHPGAIPVIFEVGPYFYAGFDERPGPDGPVIARGAAVLRFLDPGTTSTDGAWTSGGVEDPGGPARLAAIRCVADWVRGPSFPAELGAFVVVGLSSGGNPVVLDVADGLPVDGTVLWESPLLDQLMMKEPGQRGEDGAIAFVDPTFEAGTCTLASGCPFPGRGPQLRVPPGAHPTVFRDLDGDGVLGAGEPFYELNEGIPSLELWDEVAAQDPAIVFGGPIPGTWPSRPEVVAWWASRAATPGLVALKAQGGGNFLLIGTRDDHVQLFHEHERLALEALAGAHFVRLNPDAAYVAEVGGTLVEADPGPDLSNLPELPDAVLIQAAELELVDRVAAGVWDPDLDEVIDVR